MARRGIGFRKSVRQQRESSNATQSWYASAMDDGPRKDAAMERLAAERAAIKPKRVRGARRDLEGPVVKAISQLLAVHPRVLWAARFNSGAAGEFSHIWFHKFLRMPEPMRMPDFFGLLIYRGVPFAIEAKAPGWTKPTDQREREQAAFLKMIRDCGGRAGFATSVEEAQRIIEG